MISPLSIATKGRIARSAKRTLTYATLGWIVISGGPVPPLPPNYNTDGYKDERYHIDFEKKRIILLKEDDEVLGIIKAFLQCQK